MAVVKILTSFLPFIFATLALGFVVTSFLSSDWAHQDFYPLVSQIDGTATVEWYNSIFAKYRSPFVICGFDQQKPNASTTQIDVQCHRFKIYGAGKTSCETLRSHNYTITNSDSIRDDRMCQQIHMSGDLLITALVFVIVGFVICVPLTFFSLAFVLGPKNSEQSGEDDSTTTRSAAPMSSQNNKNDKSETVTAVQPRHRRRHQHHGNRHISNAITFSTYAMIVSFSIGAVATLLSQFYGIMGLIQSNPENGSFATSLAMPPALYDDIAFGPWVQGKGLTVYTSLTWLFGALAAGAAGGVWGRWLYR